MASTVILFSCFTWPALAQEGAAKQGTWSGVIIHSECTADEAFAESAKCTENRGPGVELALYDDTTRQIYTLMPQDPAMGHLGDSVTVDGVVRGNILQVASLKLLTGIGLSVGQMAPGFSVPDQFGNPQSLDTLKGKNGTVLLFFRSADW